MATTVEQQEGQRKGGDDDEHGVTITIHVNEKPVRLQGRQHTGAEIKQAAIAQGVPIQITFVLMKELGGGRTEVVGDNDRVKLTNESRFVCVHPDDNS